MSPARILSTEECDVLHALLHPSGDPADRTAARLARRLAAGPDEVTRTLQALERNSPRLVEPCFDEEMGLQLWRVTADGEDAYEHSCE
jgi:hypothetical protein